MNDSLKAPSDPAFAPDGARRSIGLAANLTLRIASASIRCRYGPATSPTCALTRALGVSGAVSPANGLRLLSRTLTEKDLPILFRQKRTQFRCERFAALDGRASSD